MLKFNKNLATIHSYLCADGYVIRNPKTQKNKYYYIGFRNMDETLLSDFEKNFHEYFKIKPRRMNDGRSVVQNKETYFKLTKDFSYYSREWTLPKLPKKYLKYWLRAFFDCEGWVTCIKAKDRSIGLDSVNRQGLVDVQKALERFGIKSKLRNRENRDILRLFIFGKENLIKFQKEIAFLHPAKKNKLQEAIDSYVVYEWNFPKKNLKKFISKLMKEKAKFKEIRKNDGLRLTSIKKVNFIKLSKHLLELYGIESKIYRHQNSHSIYYELSIQKKDHAKKAIEVFGL